MHLPWGRRLFIRSVLCAAAVAAADALFYGVGLGVNAALFAVVLLAILVVSARPGLRRREGGTVVALGVLAALPLVEEPTPLALTLAALALVVAAITSRQGWTSSLRATAQRVLSFAAVAPFQGIVDLVFLATHRRRREGGRSRAGWLLHWVGPLALAALFLGLFTLANPVISKSMGSTGEWIRHFVAGIDGARVLFWVVAATAVWAFLRVRPRAALPPFAPPARESGISVAGVVRCLVVCNLLFLVQNVLDVQYLWLGSALPEGLTYAEYAHRGAYPLVASALLAGVFVLVAFPAGGESSSRSGPRRLVLLFLAQNVFLTVCAAQRLHLYVEAYDLTRLRVAAGGWMLLVAFGLAATFWRILRLRTHRWLVGVNAAAILALLYLGALARVDRFVADYNVEHCREMGGHGGPVDTAYLRELGADALPALERLAKGARASEVRAAAGKIAAPLRERLRRDVSDWRTWTLRRRSLLQL